MYFTHLHAYNWAWSCARIEINKTPIDRELTLDWFAYLLQVYSVSNWQLTHGQCFYTDRHKHPHFHPQTSCCKMTSMHSAMGITWCTLISTVMWIVGYVDCGPHHHCTHRNCSYGHTSYLYSYRQDLTCTGMSYDHNYSYDVYSWGREQSTS